MKMQDKSVAPYSHPIHLTDEFGTKPRFYTEECGREEYPIYSYLHPNRWLNERIGSLGWHCFNIPSNRRFKYYDTSMNIDSYVSWVTPRRFLPMLRLMESTSTKSKRIIVIRDGGGEAIAICFFLPSFITSMLQYQAVWLATCNILGRENIVISRYLCTNARLLTWYE